MNSNSSSLSSGAIAGIVIGCIVGVGVICAAVIFILKKKKSSSPILSNNIESNNTQPANPEWKMKGKFVKKNMSTCDMNFPFELD